MSVHAMKRTMDPERYEKQIEFLEVEKQALQERCNQLEAKYKAQAREHNKKRLAHYQGLMNFLSELHKHLGGIQNGLLSHIGKLNSLIVDENDQNVASANKKLHEALTLLGVHVEKETKTSSGLLDYTEADED
jgi:hemerythrin-like domain-containing protein